MKIAKIMLSTDLSILFCFRIAKWVHISLCRIKMFGSGLLAVHHADTEVVFFFRLVSGGVTESEGSDYFFLAWFALF